MRGVGWELDNFLISGKIAKISPQISMSCFAKFEGNFAKHEITTTNIFAASPTEKRENNLKFCKTPGYLAGAGAITLTRLRLQLQLQF